MSQRNSEYARVKNDKYETPIPVVELVAPHIPKRISKIFDPCCGSGNVVRALSNLKHDAWGKDLEGGYDYLKDRSWHEAIVTNPPYGLAQEFIEHALAHSTFVAMLLRTDYDHAKTRRHLFKDCKSFSKMIRLNNRVVFIKRTDGIKPAPSFNHTWFIWDHARERGEPTVGWAP